MQFSRDLVWEAILGVGPLGSWIESYDEASDSVLLRFRPRPDSQTVRVPVVDLHLLGFGVRKPADPERSLTGADSRDIAGPRLCAMYFSGAVDGIVSIVTDEAGIPHPTERRWVLGDDGILRAGAVPRDPVVRVAGLEWVVACATAVAGLRDGDARLLEVADLTRRVTAARKAGQPLRKSWLALRPTATRSVPRGDKSHRLIMSAIDVLCADGRPDAELHNASRAVADMIFDVSVEAAFARSRHGSTDAGGDTMWPPDDLRSDMTGRINRLARAGLPPLVKQTRTERRR